VSHFVNAAQEFADKLTEIYANNYNTQNEVCGGCGDYSKVSLICHVCTNIFDKGKLKEH
jgi:hypothetical protein